MFEPTVDYTDFRGAFFDMSQKLGWKAWVWAFPNIHDFLSDTAQKWMFTDTFKNCHLWVLDVPASYIAWVGLVEHCEDTSGARIYNEPSPIWQADDVPMGLVKTPIRRGWVKEIHKPVYGMPL